MSDPFPDRLPIFPLPNVVLFPGALLPLHIFEQRYRRMTEDALEGDRCIGMVLLRPDGASDDDPPPVFPVGCLGRITRARRLTDGRYLIVLRGECRFRIRSEIEAPALPYRIVSADPLEDRCRLTRAEEGNLREECARVESVFLSIAGRSRPEGNELSTRIREVDPLELVHKVAFGLDLTPVEKQSVLEQDDPVERARTLRLLLEFRQAERSPAAGSRIPS